jgi:CheY-like chemotaxis protein
VGNVETKTLEIAAPRSSLTPCILDDDPEQLSVLSEMISEIGYESLLTDDPEEAVRLVQSGACRVILADVHLPGIHAYEFLDRLLRVDPGVHVIIITKEYTLESALEAIRRGATDFLPKPLDRLRLKRALDDVVSLYDRRRRAKRCCAAQVLGIGRTSLYRYLKRDQLKLGLQVKLRGAAAAGSVRV